MKKLLVRALTGAVYVAAIVCSILFTEGWGFTLLCMIFAVPAMLEFMKMTKGNSGISPLLAALDMCMALLIVPVMFLFDALTQLLWPALIILGILMLARGVAQLYVKASNPVSDFAMSVAGVCYVALPLFAAVTYMLVETPYMLLLMFVMIWLNDTGAFLVGSAIGRHRLCERLSPKKSWEGFWGGMCFSVLAGVLAATVWPGSSVFGSYIWYYAGMGVIVSLFATWGDLFESMIKRTVGVKDSGKLLPGHGGMLDRIDSLLFVAPASLIYALIWELF